MNFLGKIRDASQSDSASANRGMLINATM